MAAAAAATGEQRRGRTSSRMIWLKKSMHRRLRALVGVSNYFAGRVMYIKCNLLRNTVMEQSALESNVSVPPWHASGHALHSSPPQSIPTSSPFRLLSTQVGFLLVAKEAVCSVPEITGLACPLSRF